MQIICTYIYIFIYELVLQKYIGIIIITRLVCLRHEASCLTPSISWSQTSRLEKKVVFRKLLDKNFTKNFACGAHFQFHNHLKKLIGIKFLNTKQFPAEFPPRVLPSSPISPRVYPPPTKTQQNEMVLINYSWISPPLQSGWGLGFYISKNRRVNFPSKKERLFWDSNLWLLLIFVFVNPRNNLR